MHTTAWARILRDRDVAVRSRAGLSFEAAAAKRERQESQWRRGNITGKIGTEQNPGTIFWAHVAFITTTTTTTTATTAAAALI
jgi:hypothetical protein